MFANYNDRIHLNLLIVHIQAKYHILLDAFIDGSEVSDLLVIRCLIFHIKPAVSSRFDIQISYLKMIQMLILNNINSMIFIVKQEVTGFVVNSFNIPQALLKSHCQTSTLM